MTPDQEQRLLAESVPDGSFGGPRYDPAAGARPAPRVRRPPAPVTAAEAARHQADMHAALDGFACGTALAAGSDTKPPPPRHLRLVPDQAEVHRRAG